MLLGFPAHQLARLLLLHTLDLNLLDDDVAATDSGDDALDAFQLDFGLLERVAHRVSDDRRVHDFTLDDRVGEQWRDRDLGQLGFGPAVIDHGYFDETRADVESDRRFLAAEERHVWLGESPVSREHTTRVHLRPRTGHNCHSDRSFTADTTREGPR